MNLAPKMLIILQQILLALSKDDQCNFAGLDNASFIAAPMIPSAQSTKDSEYLNSVIFSMG
jgi:hypothetical protein